MKACAIARLGQPGDSATLALRRIEKLPATARSAKREPDVLGDLTSESKVARDDVDPSYRKQIPCSVDFQAEFKRRVTMISDHGECCDAQAP
jgi:hypothetical protein